MSDVNPISLYPGSTTQREEIVRQASKQNETLSDYCLNATKQRLARELQDQEEAIRVPSESDQQTESVTLSALFESLATELTEEIATVADVETEPELVYSVALWELLSKDYSSEQRAAAMAAAPEILSQRVKELHQNGGENA